MGGVLSLQLTNSTEALYASAAAAGLNIATGHICIYSLNGTIVAPLCFPCRPNDHFLSTEEGNAL